MTKLYKYRTFGVNSLTELCESEVYFSDPKNFNDPLDCSPTLINDLELVNVEKLTHRMILQNQSKEKADKKIQHLRYMSTEYGDNKVDIDVQNYYIRMLIQEIKCQLDSTMKSRGVLSMTSHWNSPLMWSHYANEHKGICIEYDISQAVCKRPKAVDYLGERGIHLSKVSDYVFNNSINATEEIEHKYFYTKANQWSYEKEWRYVSERQGSTSDPFHLSAVYFGMRCEYSVISSIVKLLNGSESKISFYKAYACQSTFEILRHEVEIDELMACTPRPSAALAFGTIPIE